MRFFSWFRRREKAPKLVAEPAVRRPRLYAAPKTVPLPTVPAYEPSIADRGQGVDTPSSDAGGGDFGGAGASGDWSSDSSSGGGFDSGNSNGSDY